MIEQLRIYEIFENNKDAFHARFRDHAARIMKTYGFDIAAMWEAKAKDRTEFVYVLRWPDEATMRESWARFMQDAEWSKIKDSSAAEHGRMVGAIEERVMQRTSYSP
ncbi:MULTISPECIES: NIPSNAP family protein [unclassified Bosea (in: a-proteobacteria)]|uniref:NIPSNAP family protein n=1 Tax=unclassified Bosea (in: a-proteobacteria) TaxID=2653178 RepID=UPI000F75E1F8|nr:MULTISPECIES: NIPSNAP family protein [unclassified Bosea (in: a-proteobacteria)]AZO81135.1 NIPSNAP family containing protein [Bosea sp. Tri-49]RXT26527.1 NIPSNAP family containing protein [Bosea sp. Tri-39]RXT33128.1 NIPSNAP family containing protein [Bosea sp. Tri-54]